MTRTHSASLHPTLRTPATLDPRRWLVTVNGVAQHPELLLDYDVAIAEFRSLVVTRADAHVEIRASEALE